MNPTPVIWWGRCQFPLIKRLLALRSAAFICVRMSWRLSVMTAPPTITPPRQSSPQPAMLISMLKLIRKPSPSRRRGVFPAMIWPWLGRLALMSSTAILKRELLKMPSFRQPAAISGLMPPSHQISATLLLRYQGQAGRILSAARSQSMSSSQIRKRLPAETAGRITSA